MSTNATSHRIRSISVIGGFLDGAQFDLSDGLNCFIGARGTGKTTAIEFVRYALDMLPSREEDPAERRRIESLVQENLDGGRIQVGIETKDGLVYVVSRSWGEEPIVLDADRQPTDVTLRRGAVFRADIYSQNEVERIADQATSQLDLIDNFESQKLQELELELQQMHATLEGNASQILPLTSQLGALGEELSTLPNVEAQLKAFTANQGGDGAEINRAHTLKGLRDREQRAGARAQDLLSRFARDLSGLTGRLANDAGTLVDAELAQGPNGDIVRQLTAGLVSCGREADGLLIQVQQRLAAGVTEKAGGKPPASLRVTSQPTRFQGGEMTFYPDRVEVCGVKVCGGRRSGLIRRVLDVLRAKRPSGQYVALSGAELGTEVGRAGDQNRIAGCIRDFRRSTCQVLLDEARVECGLQDIVRSGGAGYRLHEWIVVRDGDSPLTETSVSGGDAVSQTEVHANRRDVPGNQSCVPVASGGDPVNVPVGLGGDPVNRQRWVMAELRRGRQLRARDIVARLGCSATTIKRDLESLRDAGQIEFVGPPKTGHYRLKGTAKPR